MRAQEEASSKVVMPGRADRTSMRNETSHTCGAQSRNLVLKTLRLSRRSRDLGVASDKLMVTACGLLLLD